MGKKREAYAVMTGDTVKSARLPESVLASLNKRIRQINEARRPGKLL